VEVAAAGSTNRDIRSSTRVADWFDHRGEEHWPLPHGENHLAEIMISCIRRGRDRSVTFDFAEFSAIALRFIGASCAVSDVIERMPASYLVPVNDLLTLASDAEERSLLSEFLLKEGAVQVIASATLNTNHT
jgi:hypothetical protein